MSEGCTLPFLQVDAFTDRPFTGNPAAVLVLEDRLDARAMQAIASEMNLSETAFTGLDDEGRRWLRWFTPAVEVPLCGHATLATAHVLFEGGNPGPLRFESASGPLAVHRDGDRLRMDFPADPPHPADPPEGLLEALGCPPSSSSLRSRHVWVVRVDDESILRSLAPRFSALGDIDLGEGGLGVTVTAPGDGPVDFVSRFFCPWVGIDEDPVTGVAHTALTPYWAAQLGVETMEARQVSQRQGALTVRLAGERVHLSGSAVTVARGEIVVPESRRSP
jgi:PhzF family phenazine biosynthesis protein